MSCAGNFLPKIELRRHDAAGDVVAQSAGHAQALALGGGRAGDDDHTIKVLLNMRLIQQGNVEAKPVFPRFCNRDECSPAFTDARMKDRLELLPGVFVVKNAVAQGGAIGCPIFMEDGRSELLPHGGLDMPVAREQLVRTLIRVENLRAQFTGQGPCICGFSRGNAAGDAKRGHFARLLRHQRKIKRSLSFDQRERLDFLLLLLIRAHRFAGGSDEARGDKDDEMPFQMLVHI